MFTYIERIDWHLFVSSPISIKYKYKLAIGSLQVLINQSVCGYLTDVKQMSNTLLKNFPTELKNKIGQHFQIQIFCLAKEMREIRR